MTDHHQIVVVSGGQASGKSLLTRSAMVGGPWIAHREIDVAGLGLTSGTVLADIRRACVDLYHAKDLKGQGLTALVIEGACAPDEWELDNLEENMAAVARPDFVYLITTPNFETR